MIIGLTSKVVHKPWGRRDLPAWFAPAPAAGEPVGEIWYEHPDGKRDSLLAKYLFTSQKLSIQVHPTDAYARQTGGSGGKDEAWLVLGAEPDACIGIGLTRSISREELRDAVADGSIEELVDWRPAAVGDIYYVRAGTIHALGPGLKVLEVQQNYDVTYRLFDYGRPRELHVDAALEVAVREPSDAQPTPPAPREERACIANGPAFALERWRGGAPQVVTASPKRPSLVIPVAGEARLGGIAITAGGAWALDAPAELVPGEGADLIVAYPR
jgi:mannose-6-phosphate isomerase